MSRGWIAGIGLVAMVAGCGGSGPGHPAASTAISVSGDLTVAANSNFLNQKHIYIGNPCTADPGSFGDIASGTQVVVEDQSGSTLALGSLSSGYLSGKAGQPVFTLQCTFPFFVSDVPASHPFYRVAVGRRGAEQYTRAQMGHPIHLKLS